MKNLKFGWFILLLLLGFTFTACPSESSSEQAGDAIEEAAEDTGDALEEVGEEIEEGVEDAGGN